MWVKVTLTSHFSCPFIPSWFFPLAKSSQRPEGKEAQEVILSIGVGLPTGYTEKGKGGWANGEKIAQLLTEMRKITFGWQRFQNIHTLGVKDVGGITCPNN